LNFKITDDSSALFLNNKMANCAKDIILLIKTANSVGGVELCHRDLTLKSLPHPKGHGFVVIDFNNQFYEVQSVQPRKYSSWFINQRVSSSQTIYLANVIDPRFICLPFLEKQTKYSPLDQIIFLDNKFARFPFNRVNEWKMDEICDVNDKLGDDMILYRYNEGKVEAWLKKKVETTAKVIMEQRIAKAKKLNSTVSAGFNASKQSTAVKIASAVEGSSIESATECTSLVYEMCKHFSFFFF
jgi:hypothetical protein